MTSCATCQAELVVTKWGELCGACALSAGLADDDSRIADYECFHRLGEGSMGTVYLAKHVASDEVVALKLAKAELLQEPFGLALFRRQAKIESALQHPNIVHVQGAGTHRGQPFLIMPLMEGGTLAEPANAARYASAEARLELVLTIAHAVQYAHERGVLHCDLKPENILFDAGGRPFVSDFGLARSITDTGVAEADGVRGGTSGWMSPEQVRGWMSPEHVQGAALTTASDVFALGVLLHWLNVRVLPFGKGPDFEARVLSDAPPPLRRWTPELAWGLEAVAHRALQKDPRRRYPSAAALVDDLERLRAQRAIRGWSLPVWARAWYWAQRHTGARNAILLLLPLFALLTSFMAASQRAELRRAVLDMNAYAASGQAAAVLYQLHDYAETIERAALDPAVQRLTHGPLRVPTSGGAGDACSVQTSLEDPSALLPYAEKFASFFVHDNEGCARARVAQGVTQPDYLRTTYDRRDYLAEDFDGVQRPQRATHVRTAYRSSVSQLIKFGVSTPLFKDGKWIGIVGGSLFAASTLELPRMRRTETRDQMTVLLGPFEGERSGGHPLRSDATEVEFTFLVHPRLARGQKITLDATMARELARVLRLPKSGAPQFELATLQPLEHANYRDPLLHDTFLAAFAPVGGTGLVVLVQTRDEVAIRPSHGLTRSALALALTSAALLSVWSSFFFWRRYRERVMN